MSVNKNGIIVWLRSWFDDLYVQKVAGKGLSTNDYTTSEKSKLANIEARANRTIVDSALNSSSTNPVENQVITQAFEDMHIKVVTQLPTPSSNYSNDVYILVAGASATTGMYICDYVLESTDDDILGYGEWKWIPLSKSLGFDEIYPVGSIYMSVNSTNPQYLFGGTWVKLENKFLLGSGSSYTSGATGGSADAVVVKHNHTQNPHNHTQNPHKHRQYHKYRSSSGSSSSFAGSTGNQVDRYTDDTTATNNPTTAENNETGEDGTGKNMPPYLVVNMWKRTE